MKQNLFFKLKNKIMKTKNKNNRQYLKWIILLVLPLTFGALKAQTNVTSVGAKVGFSSSSFRSAHISDVSRRNLATMGGYLNFAPGKGIFSIQPEVLYAPKGSTFSYGGVRYEYKLNYIEVPVLLKLSIPIGGTFYPNIFAGPQAGFRLSEKRSVISSNGTQAVSTQKTNGVDYGGVFGGGIDIKLDNVVLGFDGRYMLGANELESADEFSDIRNGSFSLNFGIGIILK